MRVAATEPTWDIIRGKFDEPTQRNRYELTVIEEHMGGGRYGEPRAVAGDVAEFFVSTCK